MRAGWIFVHREDSTSPERSKILRTFQKTFNIRFRSLELLNLSFTHRSYCNENPSRQRNNERLEFLGDAVLGMVVASRLYGMFESKPEGELARIKSFIVSEDTLSGLSLSLGLDGLLLMGKGEEMSGGRKKKAILADALEALIGAYFLDSGIEAASDLVRRLVEPEIEKVLRNRHKKDYKTIIQEYVQKYVQKYAQTHPVYEEGEGRGPDHDRTFRVSCVIGPNSYGPGEGKNKKEAEQAAARAAYEAIIAEGGLESARLLQIEER